jgi:hypothetical protein
MEDLTHGERIVKLETEVKNLTSQTTEIFNRLRAMELRLYLVIGALYGGKELFKHLVP